MRAIVPDSKKTYMSCIALLLLASGCVSDNQSVMIVNNVIPDPNNDCEVEVNLTAGSGQIQLNKDVAATGAWDIAIRNNYWMCPEILNLLKQTRDVKNLKGEANMVTLTSYEVQYDWGPDLRAEFGSDSDYPITYPRSQGFRDIVTTTIPPGGRYVECVPVVPEDVGGLLQKLDFWTTMPPAFRTYFIVKLKFYGETSGGRQVETNEFTYRVNIGRGWAFYVPNEKECTDKEPTQEPCFWGQDHPPAVLVDCRLARDLYDQIYPLIDGKSQCCPDWPPEEEQQ